MDNPYVKLEEAQRVYLNPTISLIKEEANLSDHCYYLIKKYPAHAHGLWETLLHRNWEQIEELKIETKLKANLQLAKKNDDDAYLEYLLSHRPGKKLTLKLVRKNPIVSEEFCRRLQLQDPGEITALSLKRFINQYISQQKLQVKNMIKLDPVLREVLKMEASDKAEELHFYQLHRVFNQKYLVQN